MIHRLIRKIPPSFRVPVGISIFLHILLISFLFIKMPHPAYRMPETHAKVEIVKAVAVSSSEVDAQIKAIKRREQRKHAAEQARIKRLQSAALAAKRKRVQEERALVRIKAEHKRLEQQKIAKAKALKSEKRRLKALREKRKKKAQQMLAQQRKKLAEQQLEKQMVAEQKQLAQAKSKRIQGIVNQYAVQMQNKVRQFWVKPEHLSQSDSSSTYSIRLAPGGEVLTVMLSHSSGSQTFDESAKVAIFKASPLPVPEDTVIFDKFRQFDFTFHS